VVVKGGEGEGAVDCDVAHVVVNVTSVPKWVSEKKSPWR